MVIVLDHSHLSGHYRDLLKEQVNFRAKVLRSCGAIPLPNPAMNMTGLVKLLPGAII